MPFRARCAVAHILSLVTLTGAAAAAAEVETCAPHAGTAERVAEVLDGETVRLEDGREVRLVGALAPRPARLDSAAADWPPAREARRALEALVGGRRVTLRYEGRRQDRYGRLLAQLTVESGAGTAWVQARLVGDGLARAYALPGNAGCIKALIAAEQAARAARRGLWGTDVFAIDAAGETEGLLRRGGQFAIVEGRVAAVGRTQQAVYINFGADWRRDFTASLPHRLVTRTPGGAERIAALPGRQVRVRGWIERRNGPMIALASLDEIEILDAVSETLPR